MYGGRSDRQVYGDSQWTFSDVADIPSEHVDIAMSQTWFIQDRNPRISGVFAF